jgi:predicted metal-dependent hydrolase
MRLRVFPDGRIALTVPLEQDERELDRFVQAHLPWLRRHLVRFAAQEQERQRLAAELPSKDEARLVLGRFLPLRKLVTEQRAAARLEGTQEQLLLRVRADATEAQQESAIRDYYRRLAIEVVAPLAERWSAHLGVTVTHLGWKWMRSRWGSCNPRARRIWLNLELLKHPPETLEYVLVHEFLHFFVRDHSERFYALLDDVLPDWRARRELLRGKLRDGA